jgi:hypothetical protein
LRLLEARLCPTPCPFTSCAPKMLLVPLLPAGFGHSWLTESHDDLEV